MVSDDREIFCKDFLTIDLQQRCDAAFGLRWREGEGGLIQGP